MTYHSLESNCVRECGLFDACDEREIEAIARAARTRAFARGKCVYEHDTAARDAHVLLDGGVKLCSEAGKGRRRVMRLIYPVELFGLLDVLVDRRRNFTATTFAASEILVVEGDVLVKVLNANARFAVQMLRRSGERIREYANWWGRSNQLGAREKVAAYLMEEDRVRQDTHDERASPTRRDIASLLGITPETLSRELAYFRDRGLVRFERNGLLRIDDADSLAALVEA